MTCRCRAGDGFSEEPPHYRGGVVFSPFRSWELCCWENFAPGRVSQGKHPHEHKNKDPVFQALSLGPRSKTRPGVGPKLVSAWWLGSCPWSLVGSQPEVEKSAFRCGLTTHRRNRSGLVYCGLGSVLRQAPLQPDPWLWKLAFGTCNVTSLEGKELQLVERVE